jgi:hypothetical protein
MEIDVPATILLGVASSRLVAWGGGSLYSVTVK